MFLDFAEFAFQSKCPSALCATTLSINPHPYITYNNKEFFTPPQLSLCVRVVVFKAIE